MLLWSGLKPLQRAWITLQFRIIMPNSHYPTPSPRLNFVYYWLPVIILCAIIFLQSSFTAPDVLPRWPLSDKFLHAGIYALLGALFCRAYSSLNAWHRRPARFFIAGVVSATLYGLSDEWHQSFVPERSADAMDLLADAIGSVMGSFVYAFFIRSSRVD